ncbi:MAG: diguanylate cyclase [Psychromonas sp.]|nr:diguanylate cyclase [Psychromonas sp.]
MLKFFSLFILLFSVSPLQGALNESEKPNQINVYLEQNPPYSAFNQQTAQGLLVDYWQRWSRFTGIAVQYHRYLQQDLSRLSSDNQPAVYSGLAAAPETLINLIAQPLFIIKSRFYFFSKTNAQITSSFFNKQSAITVGGILANAQQLPFFQAATNIYYREYSGLLELLIAIYSGQIDALVLFEGEQNHLTLLNRFLSLLFAEKLSSSADNELSVYVPEKQKAVLEWINWGNQSENIDDAIVSAVNKAANPIWGTSSNIQTKIFIALGVVFLFLIFNRSRRKKDKQFKNILDDSPYPVAIFSVDGSVIYYFNDEVQLLFPMNKANNQYTFGDPENQLLLSNFINKASHKIMIEAEPIRLFVDGRFHDIEISAKRVYYQGKTAWLCYLKDVDALLQAEQKLTEEKALLRKVLDSIPEQIAFKSPKGTIIGCNESWANANNTKVVKATGKRLADLLSADLVNKQKKQELAVWKGKAFNAQEWLRQKNNKLSLINTTKLPLYNNEEKIFAILSIESDVTDLYNLNKKLNDENLQRKKTEIALSQQNTLLSSVFAASVDPIGLLDQDGRVIGANNAFAILMGAANADDVIGQLQSEFLSAESCDWAECQNQEVLNSGKPLIFDQQILFKGNEIWYEVCKTPFKDSESSYQGIVIMARDITLHKQTEERLSSAASDFELKMLHDPLTGIANRRAFDLQCEKLWQEACDEQELLSVVMCDIDFFKAFNDNYGHQKGDQALQGVAKALESACEKSGSFVARYGGEEFVVLIKGGNATKALKVTEALREAIGESKIEHIYSSVSTVITMSMGLSSIFPSALNTMAMLLAQADSAMYNAKKQGRNQICVH